MAGPLDLWTKIKDSQILSSNSSKTAGPLDLWTKIKYSQILSCEPSKINGPLDLWTIGPLDQNQKLTDYMI